MVKPAEKITGNQPDLFQQLHEPTMDKQNAPELCIHLELVGALATAIRLARRNYNYSREHIVDRMNMCLGDAEHVTLRQLNAWTANSQEDKRMPAEYLPAFCWATHSIGPFQALLDPIDYEPVDLRDQQALRLGRVTVEKARLSREERQLRTTLGG